MNGAEHYRQAEQLAAVVQARYAEMRDKATELPIDVYQVRLAEMQMLATLAQARATLARVGLEADLAIYSRHGGQLEEVAADAWRSAATGDE